MWQTYHIKKVRFFGVPTAEDMELLPAAKEVLGLRFDHLGLMSLELHFNTCYTLLYKVIVILYMLVLIIIQVSQQ